MSPEEIAAAKAAEKAAQDAIMREQEALMMAKYGGMKPKKKGGAALPKVRTLRNPGF
jgi:hypothetical protein